MVVVASVFVLVSPPFKGWSVEEDDGRSVFRLPERALFREEERALASARLLRWLLRFDVLS